MQWVQDLKSVYDSIEEVDYLVGCLAESPRPSGYVISNTAFYVFIMNASRRILCDRFYQVQLSGSAQRWLAACTEIEPLQAPC